MSSHSHITPKLALMIQGLLSERLNLSLFSSGTQRILHQQTLKYALIQFERSLKVKSTYLIFFLLFLSFD